MKKNKLPRKSSKPLPQPDDIVVTVPCDRCTNPGAFDDADDWYCKPYTRQTEKKGSGG